jgi:hypothetical protein
MEYQPTTSEMIFWSIDPADGTVQGPLDLSFMRGKVLHLTLTSGQVALHVESGQLSAIFMEGVHAMRVGRMAGDLSPASEIVFLSTDHPYTLQWEGEEAVWLPGDDGQKHETWIGGRCICHITGPESFYATFLRNAENDGAQFASRVIDSLVRSQIEKRVSAELATQQAPETELASVLAELTAADIDPALREYGLGCSHLEIHLVTLRGESVPQTAGHSATGRVQKGQ